jgi:beta-lactamase class A
MLMNARMVKSGAVVGILSVMTLALALPGPAAATDPSPDRLLAEIARVATLSGGEVGVAAIHLATGRTVEFHADQPFEMASTLKLPLAVYALHLGEAGRIPLTEPLPVSREAMIEPGVLYDHFRHPGVALSTLNLVELSVTSSDNGATDVIQSRIDGGRAGANDWLRSKGFGGIRLGNRNIRETFAGGDSLAEGPTATPRDVARFLQALANGSLLSAPGTELMLDIMSRTVGDRLSLQLPPGARVLHKTGTLLGVDGIAASDIGLIESPDGDRIAIAVYLQRSPESVSHGMRDRIIGSIARSIYDHFESGSCGG